MDFIWNHTVKEIHGENGKVSSVTLVNTVDGTEEEFKQMVYLFTLEWFL